MAESRDVRIHIEHLIERAQGEILDASRQLANGITKETDRFVPPISEDIEHLVDDVFDFAERVIKGQRAMVSEMVKTINDQSRRAAEAGREATGRIGRSTTRKKAAAKRVPATKKVAAKRVPAKKKATAKRVPAKKKAVAAR